MSKGFSFTGNSYCEQHLSPKFFPLTSISQPEDCVVIYSVQSCMTCFPIKKNVGVILF